MSIFTNVINGLGKAESFLVNFFTHTSDVDATLAKLAPATKAAILATFYDTAKTVASVPSDVAAVSSGNVPLAITLSGNTWNLVKNVITDAKTDASIIKQDLQALGIVFNSNTTNSNSAAAQGVAK